MDSMNNKYHYLGAAGPTKPVERFAVLASVNRRVRHEGATEDMLECAAWSLRVVAHDSIGYATECKRYGRLGDNPSPWPSIMKLLRTRRQLDVWVVGANDTLRASGFFDMIDEGKIITRNENWNGQAVLSNPPIMITVRPAKGRGQMRVLCLGNIGIYTTDDLIEAAGDDTETTSDILSTLKSIPATADYLAQIAERYLCEWFDAVESQRLGPIKTTLASQAWAAFRHRFLSHPLLCHCDVQASNLEYAGTFSGRAECFRIGHIDGPLYHYDVKSCYPSLLKGEPIPCRLKHVREGNASSLIAAMASGYVCVADVTLSTNVPQFPLKMQSITCWPTGTFRTVLIGRELQAAMKLVPQPIVHVFAAYETDCIFDKWIDWAVGYREQCKSGNDSVGENVAKLLTNSLWGRFAKRDRHWRNVDNDCSVVDWEDWFERVPGETQMQHFRSFGGLTQCLEDEGYNREAVPIVTAFINSLGRDYLWRLMSYVGRENVVYCATDSVILTSMGNATLAGGQATMAIGQCRLSLQAVYDCLNIRGIHHYDALGLDVDAGVPMSVSRDENGVAHWSTVEPLSGPMSRGECPTARIVPRKRDTNVKYLHGVVGKDGRVTPHHILLE